MKDTASLSCGTCGRKYKKYGSLIRHELQHEKKKEVCCHLCGEIFSTEADKTKHCNEKHKKLWKCDICSRTFVAKDRLDLHVKKHETRDATVFMCNVCSKEFKLKVNLKIHVESCCGIDPQHVCGVCGKAFMTRGTLVTHTLLHTGEKIFLCRFCGKNFRLKIEMQRHERSHTGEKPFVCKVCGKAFAHRESLVTHNTLHTGVRPYMCETCGSTFSCIGNLIKHRRTHKKHEAQQHLKSSLSCWKDDVPVPDSKSEASARCLPYSSSSEQCNKKPSACGFLQNYDSHRLNFYKTDKYFQNYNFLNNEFEKYTYSHEAAVDVIQQNSKSFPPHNIFTQLEFDLVSKQQEFVSNENNHSECIPSETNNMSESVPISSPLNNGSDDELQESQTTSLVVQIEGGKDNSSGLESSEKTNCEQSKTYPKNYEPECVIQEINSKMEFVCSLCNENFAQKYLLNDHFKKHKDSEKTSHVSDEDIPLDRRLEQLEQKSKNTVSKKFICQYCNNCFEFASQLNRHRKCHMSEEKTSTACGQCGKKYTNKACLMKHELQHRQLGVFKCRVCEDGFNSKQEYRSHRLKQHAKRWSCTVCQRSFSNSSNLKNHHNNKHLGHESKSYSCNVCGKLFKQKGNLKIHVDSSCGVEPRHVCNICGKAFMSGGSLGTHLLLHTGEKTFLCRFCGKSYRLKVEMQRHERSHTGEKPFVCKVCGKAFAHRESLVTHNTLHTGVRPYMCETCGSTFSCIGNLIKHRHTHNKKYNQ